MEKEVGYFNIKDKILYHTTTQCKFKVGDIINAGTNNNGMYNKVFKTDFKAGGKSIYDSQGYVQKSKAIKIVKGKEIDDLKKVIEDYDFAIRELALEEVRKTFYKNYPSRFTSLFVASSEEDSAVWKEKMSWHKDNCQFIKLKCTGKLFVGDSRVNAKTNDNIETYIEKAKKYWDAQITETPRFEGLFEGTAEVIEVQDIK